MKANKTQPTTGALHDYLLSIPNEPQRIDAATLTQLMQNTTGAQPVMWSPSIIGFGTYHYVYESGHEGDTMAVGFLARKAALTIYGLFHYPNNQQNIDRAKELGTITHGKGGVYIKSLSDIYLDVLKVMILSAFTAHNNALLFALMQQ